MNVFTTDLARCVRSEFEDEEPTELLRQIHRYRHGVSGLNDVLEVLVPEDLDSYYNQWGRDLALEALKQVDWPHIYAILDDENYPECFDGVDE